MPSPSLQETIFSILLSAFDLLKGSFILSIPIFIFAWIGLKVREKIQSKFKFKWLFSSFLSILVLAVIVVAFSYAVPLYSQVWAESLNLQKAPDFFQPTLYDYFLVLVSSLAKILITSAIVALIALPFILLGSLVRGWFERKTGNAFLSFFLTTWLAVLAFSFLFFYVFNFAFLGIIYMLYFY